MVEAESPTPTLFIKVELMGSRTARIACQKPSHKARAD